VLLECFTALAIFIACATLIFRVVVQAMDAQERTSRLEYAADLARSAMAKIESGVATPETLQGPVPRWRDERDGSFDERLEETPWRLDIQIEPSSFDALSTVRVRAFMELESGREIGSFELVQLVNLSTVPVTEPEDEDPIQKAAKEGAKAETRGAASLPDAPDPAPEKQP
jgi:type II secretory pathway pseudopilin PulG